MKTAGLKLIKFERCFLALVLTLTMFIIAQLSGYSEIIFPEMLAILTGAWIAKKQPWSVNKRRIFILTCLASLFGVAIVKYIHIALFFQLMLCFIFAGLSLLIAKTNFVPIIAACIFPVFMGVNTWVYSLAVCIMTLLIILGQWLMEKFHMRSVNHYCVDNFDFKKQLNHWLKLFLIFGIISFIPFSSRNIFFLAPPMVVAFVEFSNPNSKARKKPLKIFLIMLLAILTGTILRLILNLYLDFPITICALFACVLLFIIFDYTRTIFPPAGGMLLIPMILNAQDVKWFPVEAIIGMVLIIPLAIYLNKK